MSKSSGYFAAFSQITVTRNGVTHVVHQQEIRRRLMNGVWVDELQPTQPPKHVRSKVVKCKAHPAPRIGKQKRSQ